MAARIQSEIDQFRQTGGNDQVYSDFVHNFLPHPNTGQVTRKVNVDAVKMSLRNIILTNKYERLRNPRFGGNIRRYLFEQFGESTKSEMSLRIRNMIERYEPRAQISEIFIVENEDMNAINISILFYVASNETQQQLDLTLYRVG